MKKFFYFLVFLGWCVVFQYGNAGPVRDSNSAFSERKEEEGEITKKQIGWFTHRPVKDNPAEQLAYARGLESAGKLRQARHQYDALVRKWHGSAEAAEAQLRYATLLEETGYYEDAFSEYEYLEKYFPGTFDFDKIFQRQLAIAKHVMESRYGGFLIFPGSKGTYRALPMFKKLFELAPYSPYAPEILFNTGLIHEENGDYREAIEVYEKILRNYAESEFSEKASFRRVYCLMKIFQKKPRDEVNSREVASAGAEYLARYPDGLNAKEVKGYLDKAKKHIENMDFEKAVFYEKHDSNNPRSAIIAYNEFIRKYPYSPLAEKAFERIKVLEGKQREKESVQR
jgi:outer membrane protein assembly factor BamD (BamD/ComL family)